VSYLGEDAVRGRSSLPATWWRISTATPSSRKAIRQPCARTIAVTTGSTLSVRWCSRARRSWVRSAKPLW